MYGIKNPQTPDYHIYERQQNIGKIIQGERVFIAYDKYLYKV